MKKILFVLHLPPPVHGSAMVGKYIKDSPLVNSTFDAKFINLSTSKTIEEIGKKPYLKVSRYLKILYQVVIRLIEDNPGTVYLAINAKDFGFYKDYPIAVLAKLFRKKLVLHYHNKGVRTNQHNFLDSILYRKLFKNSKLILLSEYLYHDVKKFVERENVFLCPNGIPVLNTEQEDLFGNNMVTQLLFLSNLMESKGVLVLLGALKILKENGIKFHCNIVGGEGDISSRRLKKKIADLHLEEYVTYLGVKYGNDKYEIFKASDLFLFPTLNDCFPLVLLEAMMFGLPVISTNEGGIPDIVRNSETGFVIDRQNSNQLAEKINWFIDNPEQAVLFGKNGKEHFLGKYTLEVFEKRLTHVLKQI